MIANLFHRWNSYKFIVVNLFVFRILINLWFDDCELVPPKFIVVNLFVFGILILLWCNNCEVVSPLKLLQVYCRKLFCFPPTFKTQTSYSDSRQVRRHINKFKHNFNWQMRCLRKKDILLQSLGADLVKQSDENST